MKINQFNINSYVNFNTRPTSQTVLVTTETISSKSNLNIMDSIRLSNMQGELRTNHAIQGNIQSGLSLIHTMDASLSSGEEMGDKLKELSIKYQSDTLSNEDKQLIEKEANELLKGIQKVFEETTFNGQKVFDKPNFSIYTGGGSYYKIETPNVSTIKDIKPIELNTNIQDAIVGEEVNPLLSTQTSLSLSVQEPVLLSSEQMTVSQISEITASQENIETMSSSVTVNETQTITDTSTTQAVQTQQSSMSNSSSPQERKDFTATMVELLGSKKEAREFFDAKNDKQMLELAKKETTESLQQRFIDKGYADKLDEAEELGLYESLGLEPPKKTEPTEPESSTPTNPTEGSGTPVEGTNPGETSGSEGSTNTGTDTGTIIDEGTATTEPAPLPEGNDGTNTGENNTDGTVNTGETTTNPSNPSSPSYQWNFAEILKEDFIEKNILGVIKKGVSNLRVHEEILQSRMNFQERVEEIKEEQIARIMDVDVAKTVAEEVKKQMLSHVREALDIHRFDQQRQLILQLLK